ncbi:unnamed protein product [Linum tenue]|uniref:Replication protein A 70 kDa DNA-binding subunit B/D first OB fold domain-containing protein n=1 Tax=Linum tenue TaxID=586396 RepID=A0AAV0Q5F0_9ROSI|nr:unnamed protein product [Linum tenue]
MDSQSIRDLESEKKIWSGQCRVSRMWLGVNVHTDKVLHLDLILMDSKGNDIWVQIPPVLIKKFKKLLKENHVYIIKNFDINTTGLKYRPIGNPYLIQFSRKTTVHHVPEVHAIPTFKFSFLNASQMAGKLGHVVILSVLCNQSCLSLWNHRHLLNSLLFHFLNFCNYKRIQTRRYRVQLEVQSDLKSAVFVLFEYEGKRYFGLSGHELFQKNGQNDDLPPDELLQLVGLTKKFHVKFKINLFADSQADFTVLRILEPTPKGEGYMIHKDGSSSSIASGPASSQPSSDQSGQSATEKSIETPVDSDANRDNKLKRKMPLE